MENLTFEKSHRPFPLSPSPGETTQIKHEIKIMSRYLAPKYDDEPNKTSPNFVSSCVKSCPEG